MALVNSSVGEDSAQAFEHIQRSVRNGAEAIQWRDFPLRTILVSQNLRPNGHC